MCQPALAEYVRSELDGDIVSTLWPSMALHIETCSNCTAAYFTEFRQQGRQRSLSELQSLGERHRTASVLDQILSRPVANQRSVADADHGVVTKPSWREQIIEHGRIWLDQSSEQVRQVSVALGELLTPIQPNAATAGLMGGPPATGESTDGGSNQSRALSGIVDLPAQSGLEVKVMAEPMRATSSAAADAADPHYQVQVAVTPLDRLGDYSGIGVTLRWDDIVLSEETDATGIARFDQLQSSALSSMSLTVSV